MTSNDEEREREQSVSIDQEELEFLRIENMLLRKKVKELESLRSDKRNMYVNLSTCSCT